MTRNFFLLVASFLMTVLALSRADITTVHADCGETGVGVGGADCGFSGSTPGDSGDGSDSGQPGGSGNNNNNSNQNSNNNGNDGAACTPGTNFAERTVYTPVGSLGIPVASMQFTLPNGTMVSGDQVPANMCAATSAWIDSCTGGSLDSSQGLIVSSDGQFHVSECPMSYIIPDHPCDEFVVSGNGVTCTSDLTEDGSRWEVSAYAGWPGIEIHARPFPITLVDWDTVMRVAGLGSSSGTGRLAYAAWGGGNNESPAPGDWKNIVLRLDIRPLTDWADVYLENIGLIRMPVGRLHTFQWNLPSHPAAGGGPLAGEVGQLEELEADTPLYSNWTRAPYMVYCSLEYYEWEATCMAGLDENGFADCGGNANGYLTGHKEWGWKRHSQTVPIPPTAARVDVPASLLADLNGDGVPDAYWGRTTFVRRMDDAGRVDNPEWAHSYSWPGPFWYWAVREAQGQVGWPGIVP